MTCVAPSAKKIVLGSQSRVCLLKVNEGWVSGGPQIHRTGGPEESVWYIRVLRLMCGFCLMCGLRRPIINNKTPRELDVGLDSIYYYSYV